MAHAAVSSWEDFRLVKFDNVAETHRVSCNLIASVFPPHHCCVLGYSDSGTGTDRQAIIVSITTLLL
ncbi:unnamed protein product, partial [Dibothriocephalus latus]